SWTGVNSSRSSPRRSATTAPLPRPTPLRSAPPRTRGTTAATPPLRAATGAATRTPPAATAAATPTRRAGTGAATPTRPAPTGAAGRRASWRTCSIEPADLPGLRRVRRRTGTGGRRAGAALPLLRPRPPLPAVPAVLRGRAERHRQVDRGPAAGGGAVRPVRGAGAGRALGGGAARPRRRAPDVPSPLTADRGDCPAERPPGGAQRHRGPARAGAAAGAGAVLPDPLPGAHLRGGGARRAAARPAGLARVGRAAHRGDARLRRLAGRGGPGPGPAGGAAGHHRRPGGADRAGGTRPGAADRRGRRPRPRRALTARRRT